MGYVFLEICWDGVVEAWRGELVLVEHSDCEALASAHGGSSAFLGAKEGALYLVEAVEGCVAGSKSLAPRETVKLLGLRIP